MAAASQSIELLDEILRENKEIEFPTDGLNARSLEFLTNASHDTRCKSECRLMSVGTKE